MNTIMFKIRNNQIDLQMMSVYYITWPCRRRETHVYVLEPDSMFYTDLSKRLFHMMGFGFCIGSYIYVEKMITCVI